jgi:hypothetical protein
MYIYLYILVLEGAHDDVLYVRRMPENKLRRSCPSSSSRMPASVLPWPAQSNALRTAVAPATPNTRALQMVVVEAPLPLMLLLRHPTHFAAT